MSKKEIQPFGSEEGMPFAQKSLRPKTSGHPPIDLDALLAESPDQCIDAQWEKLPPVGREML